jgi:hypothetical protein
VKFSLFGAELMRVTYGFDDLQKNKALIDNARTLISRFSDSMHPGRYLVNTLPSLRYIPSWFPGAGFKEDFTEIAQISFKTLYPPFEEAKSNFVRNYTALCAFRPLQVATRAPQSLDTGSEREAS